MYGLIKPLLFSMHPEKAHHFTFNMVRLISKVPGLNQVFQGMYDQTVVSDGIMLFGLHFKNRVGLAAGFDKNAVLFDQLAELGFGHIEVGTVTPEPQPGNDAPRLFRLVKDKALINRMGFNNDGVKAVAERLRKKRKRPDIIIGGNIGKNKNTPNERAFEDYRICFEELFDCVDYFVVNVSSPNTPGLRDLQEKGPLLAILQQLQAINRSKPAPKPLLLKIAPDLTNGQLDDIVEIAFEAGLSGLIATNTTISRDGLETPPAEVQEYGAGGLSGAPLLERSTEVVRYLHLKSEGKIPVIGVGGIVHPADAVRKLEAGAALVQVYTGYIYSGPPLVPGIIKAIRNWKK